MSDEHLRFFGPILHCVLSFSIWFIGRLLRAYHRTHTCLGPRLLFLENNGVGGTPPPAIWGVYN